MKSSKWVDLLIQYYKTGQSGVPRASGGDPGIVPTVEQDLLCAPRERG